MEYYTHYYIPKTGKRYHLFPICGSMRDPLRVNLNDERLNGLSLCMKCENRAEIYFQACDNSSTSLVDALKKLNIDSSFENRKKIAKTNGISNYTGKEQQNTELLNKLKEGKLKMPSKKETTTSISTSSSLNSQNDVMITKIENSNQLGNKKHALAIIGRILFSNGYETAFIAGILANVKHEGDFGFFESSNYKTYPNKKPQYLKYMDSLYKYNEKYSGKYVYQISLKALKEMCDKLKKDNWQKGKFGLGTIQWTGERAYNLVVLYLQECKNADTISLDQVISAEGKMIINELKSNNYKSIYESWKNDNKNNLNTEKAAYDAASKICIKYEVPNDKEKKAIERGNTAKQIYKIMTSK